MCVRKLARGSRHEAFKKFFLQISEVEEFNSKAVSGEKVCDLTFERHRQTLTRGYMNSYLIALGHLNDGVDIASAGADITDPCCTASGYKFKFYLSEICEAVLFSWHIV